MNQDHSLTVISEALRGLAGQDPDRASEENGVGFNKPDSAFGHSLAAIPPEAWLPGMAWQAWEMLRKYARSQLGTTLEAWDAIEPEMVLDDRGFARRWAGAVRPNLTVADGKIVVSFPYDPALIESLKGAVGSRHRHWDRHARVWWVGLSGAAQAIAWADQVGLIVMPECRELAARYEAHYEALMDAQDAPEPDPAFFLLMQEVE